MFDQTLILHQGDINCVLILFNGLIDSQVSVYELDWSQPTAIVVGNEGM